MYVSDAFVLRPAGLDALVSPADVLSATALYHTVRPVDPRLQCQRAAPLKKHYWALWYFVRALTTNAVQSSRMEG